MKKLTAIFIIIMFIFILLIIGGVLYYVYWYDKPQTEICTDVDRAALITGYIQSQTNPPTARPSPCTAYPYINNFVVTNNNNGPLLYERNMAKENTCCYFTDTNNNNGPLLAPEIFVQLNPASPISLENLNKPPYLVTAVTTASPAVIQYLLPDCDPNTSNACTAFIKVSADYYRIYHIGGLTIDPSATYPAPGTGTNLDYPQPFSFNTLNVQILKDTTFVISTVNTATATGSNYMFRAMYYQGFLLITCPTTDTNYTTCVKSPTTQYPMLVQVLAQAYFGMPLAPIPGANPPMSVFMANQYHFLPPQ